MPDEAQNPEDAPALDPRVVAEAREREEKYKSRGYQKMSWQEYKALEEKQKTNKKFSIPTHIKFILGTPFIIIFCYGIFFVPWMLYAIATSPETPPTEDEKTSIESNKNKTETNRKK